MKGKVIPCDWEIRKAEADHFIFVPCGKPGIFDFLGHPRCKKHYQASTEAFARQLKLIKKEKFQ